MSNPTQDERQKTIDDFHAWLQRMPLGDVLACLADHVLADETLRTREQWQKANAIMDHLRQAERLAKGEKEDLLRIAKRLCDALSEATKPLPPFLLRRLISLLVEQASPNHVATPSKERTQEQARYVTRQFLHYLFAKEWVFSDDAHLLGIFALAKRSTEKNGKTIEFYVTNFFPLETSPLGDREVATAGATPLVAMQNLLGSVFSSPAQSRHRAACVGFVSWLQDPSCVPPAFAALFETTVSRYDALTKEMLWGPPKASEDLGTTPPEVEQPQVPALWAEPSPRVVDAKELLPWLDAMGTYAGFARVVEALAHLYPFQEKNRAPGHPPLTEKDRLDVQSLLLRAWGRLVGEPTRTKEPEAEDTPGPKKGKPEIPVRWRRPSLFPVDPREFVSHIHAMVDYADFGTLLDAIELALLSVDDNDKETVPRLYARAVAILHHLRQAKALSQGAPVPESPEAQQGIPPEDGLTQARTTLGALLTKVPLETVLQALAQCLELHPPVEYAKGLVVPGQFTWHERRVLLRLLFSAQACPSKVLRNLSHHLVLHEQRDLSEALLRVTHQVEDAGL